MAATLTNAGLPHCPTLQPLRAAGRRLASWQTNERAISPFRFELHVHGTRLPQYVHAQVWAKLRPCSPHSARRLAEPHTDGRRAAKAQGRSRALNRDGRSEERRGGKEGRSRRSPY